MSTHEDSLAAARRRAAPRPRCPAPTAPGRGLAHHATLALTRFANSVIHQNVAEDAPRVRLRLHLDGRTRGGPATVTDDRRPGRAGRARRRRRAALPARPDLAGARRARPRRTAGPAPRRGHRAGHPRRPGRGRARLRRRRPAGWRRPATAAPRTGRAAFANRAGQAVPGRTAEAAMDGIARAAAGRPTGSPGWPPAARRPGRRGARRAGGGQGARRSRPGRAAAGPLRGGPGAGRRRRPAAQPRVVRVQRPGRQRAAVVRRGSAPTSSTRR